MADITTTTSKKQKGLTPKMKKQAIKVDLTPMVDLGFLLITFFIFTTSLAKPNAVKFRMPKDTITKMPVSRNNTLIIMADSNNKYYTYEPLTNSISLKKCATIAEVRKQIIAKKISLQQDIISVILKVHPEAKYNALIEMLDEIKINEITFYVKDTITTDEVDAIRLANLL